MSLYPILWAAEHAPVRDAEERAILSALVLKGDFDGSNCYRSYPTLARIARIDPKTAGSKCRAMEKRGILRRQTGPKPEGWKKLPKDKKPVVWEVMIPAEFWSPIQLEEINAQRQERGRVPITQENRPALPEAPPKAARSDKGKPRPERRKKRERGDSQSPRSNESGGTHSPLAGGLTVPSRGDSQSPNPPIEPSDITSSPLPPTDALASPESQAQTREEEGDFLNLQPQPQPTGADAPHGGRRAAAEELVLSLPWREGGPTASQLKSLTVLVDAAWSAGWSSEALRQELVADLGGVRSLYGVWASRLKELPAPRPAQKARPALPPRCGDARHDSYVPLDRNLYGDEGPRPCPVCHPTAIAKAQESLR